MISLFRPFDFFLFYKTYFSFFVVIILIFMRSYKSSFLNFTLSTLFLKSLGKFFFSLKSKNFNKISLAMIFVTFLSILVFNIFSVFSFNFPMTSQFSVVIFISLSTWFRFFIYNFVSNWKGFISHFIPEGTPIYLTFILFVIEVISRIIRPITLSVRLVANILAGHLLIILLSKLVFLANPIFLSYILLNLIELLVALIQAYIFATMLALYFSEVH